MSCFTSLLEFHEGANSIVHTEEIHLMPEFLKGVWKVPRLAFKTRNPESKNISCVDKE